jgi:ATP-dependent DNA helicase RecG
MTTQLSLLELLERPTVEALVKPDQIFESNDWSFIASLAEDTRFEKKSARIQPSELAVCLSAFGNGPAVMGGVVAIGIEKDGTVAGCAAAGPAKANELELMGRDNCADGRFIVRKLAVKNANGEDDFIILARVFYVEERLVELTNNTAYCREADRSRRLTDTEKQETRINKGERQFELELCTTLKYPADFREAEISRFCRKIRDQRQGSSAVSNEDILIAMRLGKRNPEGEFIPNNVCVLLFANDPRQVFPGAYVHFLRYEGTEEGTGKEYNVVKDRMLDGTVLEIIRDTSSTLDASLREFTVYRNGKFLPTPEYPHDAWYEVLVNACVHRSYHARNEPIFVKMFDDRLRVENPGAFMPSVTPENLFHKPRNPFLMFALREYGEVRCIAEGTQRIKREVKDAKLPAPEFIGSKNRVTVTLFNDVANRANALDSEAYKILGEGRAFSLDEDERKLVNYAVANQRINVSDALRILSTTDWHTARAKLQRLVRRQIFDFVSTKQRDPAAHYKLHQ